MFHWKIVKNIYNKQNNTWLLEDMKFIFSCSNRYLTKRKDKYRFRAEALCIVHYRGYPHHLPTNKRRALGFEDPVLLRNIGREWASYCPGAPGGYCAFAPNHFIPYHNPLHLSTTEEDKRIHKPRHLRTKPLLEVAFVTLSPKPYRRTDFTLVLS